MFVNSESQNPFILKKQYIVFISIITTLILGGLFIYDNLTIHGLILFISLALTIRNPEFAVGIFITDGYLFFTYFNLIGLEAFSLTIYTSLLLLIALFTKYFQQTDSEITEQKPKMVLILVVALGIILILQSLNSPGRAYGLHKSAFYFYFNVLFFLFPYYFFQGRESMERIYKQGSLIGILLILLSFLVVFFSSDTQRLDPSGSGNVIWFARTMGLISIFFYFQILNNKSTYIKTAYVFGILIALLLLNITGSRGPLIALIASIAIYFLICYRGTILKKIIIISGFIIMATFSMTMILPQIMSRFTNLSNDVSSLHRLYSASRALEHIMANPLFGSGTGSFAALVNDILLYPHNIFLEFGMENGLLVTGLFGFFLIYVFYHLVGIRNSIDREDGKYLYDISLLIFLFGLFNAQFSGDIAHNPLLWFSAGTIIVIKKNDHNRKEVLGDKK